MQNPVFLSSYLFIAQSAPFNFTHTPTSFWLKNTDYNLQLSKLTQICIGNDENVASCITNVQPYNGQATDAPSYPRAKDFDLTLFRYNRMSKVQFEAVFTGGRQPDR